MHCRGEAEIKQGSGSRVHLCPGEDTAPLKQLRENNSHQRDKECCCQAVLPPHTNTIFSFIIQTKATLLTSQDQQDSLERRQRLSSQLHFLFSHPLFLKPCLLLLWTFQNPETVGYSQTFPLHCPIRSLVSPGLFSSHP